MERIEEEIQRERERDRNDPNLNNTFYFHSFPLQSTYATRLFISSRISIALNFSTFVYPSISYEWKRFYLPYHFTVLYPALLSMSPFSSYFSSEKRAGPTSEFAFRYSYKNVASKRYVKSGIFTSIQMSCRWKFRYPGIPATSEMWNIWNSELMEFWVIWFAPKDPGKEWLSVDENGIFYLLRCNFIFILLFYSIRVLLFTTKSIVYFSIVYKLPLH